MGSMRKPDAYSACGNLSGTFTWYLGVLELDNSCGYMHTDACKS